MPFNTFYTPLVIWLIPFHSEVSIFVHRCLVWGVLKNIQKYKLVVGDEPLSSCKQEDRKLTRFGTALDPWVLWKNHVGRATINQALDIRKKPQTSAIIDFCLLKLRIFGGGGCFRLRGAPHCQKVNCRRWVTCWGPASMMTDWSLVTRLMVWWRKGLTAGNDGATRVTRWSRPRTSGLDYLGVKIQNFGSTMYCRHSFWFVWDRISDNDYKTYETSVFLDLNLKAANNHYSNWHQFDNGTPIEFRGCCAQVCKP